MARKWHPSPLLRASALVHAGAASGLVLLPESWPWALGTLAANHGLITAAGLWPRSRLLGPNWTRLPAAAAARGEVALTIDDGPDPEVTPRVLDLLARHDARASFFLIGARARRHPGLVRDIAAAGHAVENHSEHHLNTFSLRGPKWLAGEIAAAQSSLSQLTGRTPRFFRAPAGLRNPFLEPVLAGLDLQLAAWTRRAYDTRNGDADGVAARLGCAPADMRRRAGLAQPARSAGAERRATNPPPPSPEGGVSKRLGAARRRLLSHGLAAGDILLLHDGHAARTPAGEPVIIEVLPRLLAAFADAGLKPVTLDAAIP